MVALLTTLSLMALLVSALMAVFLLVLAKVANAMELTFAAEEVIPLAFVVTL
jgi:hypothetical protein